MLKEPALEQFRFTCAGCEHVWSGEYEVQHVEDGHGHECAYYLIMGVPAPAPTGRGGLCCPRCGAVWVHVELLARRDLPSGLPGLAADSGPAGSPESRRNLCLRA